MRSQRINKAVIQLGDDFLNRIAVESTETQEPVPLESVSIPIGIVSGVKLRDQISRLFR